MNNNVNYSATVCKHGSQVCGSIGTSGYCADCPFDYSKQQITYSYSGSSVWQLCPKCNGSGHAMNYNGAML